MDMTGQPRLFAAAIESIIVDAHYDGHHGWCVRLNWRRSGDSWADEAASFYGGLVPSELIDVVTAELELLLNS